MIKTIPLLPQRKNAETMKLQIIDTGYFYADGGAMFGAIPKSAWSRRYPSDETNGCVLAMRSLVIKTDDGRIVLVDNGAGNKHLKQLSYYRFFNLVDLGTELRNRGIQPEEITDVVLTHLHFDHCGYTTQKDESTGHLFLSFPNANHWVSRKQWENFLHPNALEKDSYFIENMQAVADANSLRLLDADTSICPTIELRLYDGHTPGKLFPISIRKIGLCLCRRCYPPCSQRIPGMDLRLRHVSGHVIQRETAHACRSRRKKASAHLLP